MALVEADSTHRDGSMGSAGAVGWARFDTLCKKMLDGQVGGLFHYVSTRTERVLSGAETRGHVFLSSILLTRE